VTIKQLTADDLRARGITIDSRNYDVYERPRSTAGTLVATRMQ
jgi:hypothetical protein